MIFFSTSISILIAIIKMIFKSCLLFISIISGRKLNRLDSDRSLSDSLVSLGNRAHGHAIMDEAFFYDFLSLSIEFNKHNLDAYVQVNIDPNFTGFTTTQFNDLLEKWIFAMLATGYWSNCQHVEHPILSKGTMQSERLCNMVHIILTLYGLCFPRLSCHSI